MAEKMKTFTSYVNLGTLLITVGIVILFFNLRSTYQAGLRNQAYSRYNSCALSRVITIPNEEKERRKAESESCWQEAQKDVGVQIKQYNTSE